MLSPELIKQIKTLQFKAGHLVTEAMAGEYISAFKGTGIEFEKVREYHPGDEVRAIDWNVTARMNAPYIKVFHEERELTLMLMVDVSASQVFGSQQRFKHEIAAEMVAVLAFLAIKNHDKVGLIIFSDQVERFIPAKKGRAHVWRIIREILTHETKVSRNNGTRIDLALNYLLQVCKRKSMCFLVSDFQAESYERSLKLASKKHDLTCISVEDQREFILPDCGLMELVDAESGRTLVLDSHDSKVKKIYEESYKQQRAQRLELFKKLNIGHFAIQSQESVINPLYLHMRKRETKGKKS